MECECGVTRRIIDELHSLDIQGDQMEGEIGDTQVSLTNSFYGSPTRSNGN